MARDPGLQPERTALSWQRTGVSALLVAAGAALAAAHRGGRVVLVAALAALAVSSATAVPPRPHSGAPYVRLVRAAVSTVALAAVGVLLTLT